MAVLEIYWSFRSPYSYLAIDRLCAIRAAYEVDVTFRPVRPLAMREPDFFERGRKQFVPYLMRDYPREAERLGLPYGLPNPDPIKMDMTSGKVDPQQPLMTRLMALAIAACHHERGLEFARAMAARRRSPPEALAASRAMSMPSWSAIAATSCSAGGFAPPIA